MTTIVLTVSIGYAIVAGAVLRLVQPRERRRLSRRQRAIIRYYHA